MHRPVEEGGVLLIETRSSAWNGLWDNYSQFAIYQDEQFRFAEALPKEIQRMLTVRLHSAYKQFNWGDEERWDERCPEIRIEKGAVPIKKLLRQSRLTIYSYDSTGMLECLALNIPIMCFWHDGMNDMIPSAKPYYELLRSVGIFHETPEQAAAMVTSHIGNVSKRWGSPKVQSARKIFCAQYSRTEERPIRQLKHLLTAHEKK